MAYEEFIFKKRASIDSPMISILKQGTIGINSACYEKYFKDFKYVIFLFDKENRKIGFRPTNNPSSNAYNIRVSRNGKLVNVSATSFLKYYGIPFTESKSYHCLWNESEKIVEIELN